MTLFRSHVWDIAIEASRRRTGRAVTFDGPSTRG